MSLLTFSSNVNALPRAILRETCSTLKEPRVNSSIQTTLQKGDAVYLSHRFESWIKVAVANRGVVGWAPISCLKSDHDLAGWQTEDELLSRKSDQQMLRAQDDLERFLAEAKRRRERSYQDEIDPGIFVGRDRYRDLSDRVSELEEKVESLEKRATRGHAVQ